MNSVGFTRLSNGLFFGGIALLTAMSASLQAMEERKPVYRSERVLASVPVDGENPYLAFPAVLDLGDEVLVSFKRGGFHGGGAPASLDLLRLNKLSDAVAWKPGLARAADKIMQMGEWVHYPDGTIANSVSYTHLTLPTKRIV